MIGFIFFVIGLIVFLGTLFVIGETLGSKLVGCGHCGDKVPKREVMLYCHDKNVCAGCFKAGVHLSMESRKRLGLA